MKDDFKVGVKNVTLNILGLFKKNYNDKVIRISKELELISENRVIERTVYTLRVPQDKFLLLSLDPRRRKIQINQEVRDNKGNKIILLPSEKTEEIYTSFFQEYLSDYNISYNKIFGSSPDDKEIEKVLKLIENLKKKEQNTDILLTLAAIYKEKAYQP